MFFHLKHATAWTGLERPDKDHLTSERPTLWGKSTVISFHKYSLVLTM